MQWVLTLNNAFETLRTKVDSLNVLVIGDVMIDEYHYCKVERKTPEGPFLVWELQEVRKELGGAGNLARNLATLGATVTLAGVVGDGIPQELAQRYGIKTIFSAANDGRPTTTKRRFIDNETKALLAREDIESKNPISRETVSGIVARIKEKYDVLILSDYAKGLFWKETIPISSSVKAALKIADSKPQNAGFFKDVDVIKMNFKEFAEVAKNFGYNVENTNSSVEQVGKELLKQFSNDFLITRSENGISYISSSGVFHSPVQVKEVVDIMGAGDTVCAMFAVARAVGLDIPTSLHLSNLAASIAVSRRGTVSVTLDEVEGLINSEKRKIVSLEELKEITKKLRTNGKKIVFTNGCFDILHHGHLYFLSEAKSLGDILIVGLNSDAGVRKLKGEGRPRMPQHARAELLAALSTVDYVVIFDNDTAESLVDELKPEIYVKGKDYKMEALPEARIVQSYGGKTILIDLRTEKGKKISSRDFR